MWSIPGVRGAGATAVFVRIADAVTDDIRRGVLRAGDRLPSTRALATELGVNRNTVVAAFEELAAQGLIDLAGFGGHVRRGCVARSARAARGGGHPRIRGARAVRADGGHRTAVAGRAGRCALSALGGFSGSAAVSTRGDGARVSASAACAQREHDAPATAIQPDRGGCAGRSPRCFRATRAVPATAENILITRAAIPRRMSVGLRTRSYARRRAYRLPAVM